MKKKDKSDPTTCDVKELLDNATTLFNDYQTKSSVNSEQQELLALEVDLDKTKTTLSTAQSNYEGANKTYVIAKHGQGYYDRMQSEEAKERRKKELEANIEVFIQSLNSSNMEIESLKMEIDNLNLIKKLFENNKVNDNLEDLFGFTLSPGILKGELGQEPFETLETINRKVYYEYNKNKFTNTLKRILYILYYFLSILAIIYLFTNNFKNIDRKKKIIITILLFLYPFLKFFVIIIYDILKIIFRFLGF